jgi:signal transduction histidine kinase
MNHIVTPRRRFRRSFEQGLRKLVLSMVGGSLQAARRAAAAEERARIGRELHDGIVQQLLCIDVDLELLRRGHGSEPRVAEALARVQERLRSESTSLRELIARPYTPAVDASQLPAVITELVDRFERETGIAADYQSNGNAVPLPSRVCGELARIVQEALVNVRRHSGAGRVRVRVGCDPDEVTLSIRDDGRGFPALAASGPFPAGRTATPVVIRERVRTIGGTLRLAPTAVGAHLLITVPRNGPWTTATSSGS